MNEETLTKWLAMQLNSARDELLRSRELALQVVNIVVTDNEHLSPATRKAIEILSAEWEKPMKGCDEVPERFLVESKKKGVND